MRDSGEEKEVIYMHIQTHIHIADNLLGDVPVGAMAWGGPFLIPPSSLMKDLPLYKEGNHLEP